MNQSNVASERVKVHVTSSIHMCNIAHSFVRLDSFIRESWLVHMCDMTHSYVWRDSFRCVTWLIHMRDTTHSYVWHDSFICVTWLIHTRDMTHQHMWNDCFILVGAPAVMCVRKTTHVQWIYIYIYIYELWLIDMHDPDSFKHVMCLIYNHDTIRKYMWYYKKRNHLYCWHEIYVISLWHKSKTSLQLFHYIKICVISLVCMYAGAPWRRVRILTYVRWFIRICDGDRTNAMTDSHAWSWLINACATTRLFMRRCPSSDV